jgi:hypothetical protein
VFRERGDLSPRARGSPARLSESSASGRSSRKVTVNNSRQPAAGYSNFSPARRAHAPSLMWRPRCSPCRGRCIAARPQGALPARRARPRMPRAGLLGRAGARGSPGPCRAPGGRKKRRASREAGRLRSCSKSRFRSSSSRTRGRERRGERSLVRSYLLSGH